MDVRQYIGARYVPKFYQNSLDPTSSEWESNVEYEPLTWVSLPNMHTYLSKKTVPANVGSPVDNPEYWQDCGSDNAYIQDLQDQVDVINGTITTMDGDIDLLETVQNFKTRYAGKKFVIYGDSLSAQSLNDDWVTPFTALVESIGGTVTNHAISGGQAMHMVTRAAADLTAYDVAIVWIGINDANQGRAFGLPTDNNTFTNDYDTLLSTIQANSPNADIFCFGISYATNKFNVKKSAYFYNQCEEDIALSRGAIFKTMLGLPHNGPSDNSATVDGIHFKEAYSKTVIFNRILKGLINPAAETNPTITLNVNNLVTADENSSFTTKQFYIDVKSGYLDINAIIENTSGYIFGSLDLITHPKSGFYCEANGHSVGFSSGNQIQCAGGPAGTFVVNLQALLNYKVQTIVQA